MTWRVARSLNVLLDQLNDLAPNRDKDSDGSIGDAAHATRDSDHNPWYGPGIVTARDFTHDPDGGLSGHWLASVLVQSGDTRIKYIIWDRMIWSAGSWRRYTGTNPHTKHLHLSVVASPACDDETPWELGEDMSQADVNYIRDKVTRIERMLFAGGGVAGSVADESMANDLDNIEAMLYEGGSVKGSVAPGSLFARMETVEVGVAETSTMVRELDSAIASLMGKVDALLSLAQSKP